MKHVGVYVVLSISTVHLHSSYPSPLIASIIDGIKSQYQALSISIYTDIEAQWVMITASVSTRTPFPGRPVPNPRMLLRFSFAQGNNTYIFEVNFVALHTGPIGGSSHRKIRHYRARSTEERRRRRRMPNLKCISWDI